MPHELCQCLIKLNQEKTDNTCAVTQMQGRPVVYIFPVKYPELTSSQCCVRHRVWIGNIVD